MQHIEWEPSLGGAPWEVVNGEAGCRSSRRRQLVGAFQTTSLDDNTVGVADLEGALAPLLGSERHGDDDPLVLQPGQLHFEVVDVEGENQTGGVDITLVGGQGWQAATHRKITFMPQSSRNRPELDTVLAQLRPGDSLVVWRLDRLGRSLWHLIDATTSGGRLVFHLSPPRAETVVQQAEMIIFRRVLTRRAGREQ